MIFVEYDQFKDLGIYKYHVPFSPTIGINNSSVKTAKTPLNYSKIDGQVFNLGFI